MKNFLSIGRRITRRSKSLTGYPFITVLDIVKLHDKILSETNDVFQVSRVWGKYNKNMDYRSRKEYDQSPTLWKPYRRTLVLKFNL